MRSLQVVLFSQKVLVHLLILAIILIFCNHSLSGQDPGIERFCTVNVNCLQGATWKKQRNTSIAVTNNYALPSSDPEDETESIDFEQSLGSGTILFTNKGESRKYYLLSAAHVFIKRYPRDNDRRGREFYELPRNVNITVNFQNQYCPHESDLSGTSATYTFYADDYKNPRNGNKYRVLAIGEGWRSDDGNNPAQDYVLIELSFATGDFDPKQGICFSGWNADPSLNINAIKELVQISHPGVYGTVNGVFKSDDLKKISSIQFSSGSQTNNNMFITYWENQFEVGWIGGGASGCGVWGKNSDDSQTELIGIFVRIHPRNDMSCSNDRLNLGTTMVRFSHIWNNGRLWRFLDKDRDPNNVFATIVCPLPPDCFDGEQNQGEDDVDCCETNTGCTVCPPCRPPLGTGGGGDESAC